MTVAAGSVDAGGAGDCLVAAGAGAGGATGVIRGVRGCEARAPGGAVTSVGLRGVRAGCRGALADRLSGAGGFLLAQRRLQAMMPGNAVVGRLAMTGVGLVKVVLRMRGLRFS